MNTEGAPVATQRSKGGGRYAVATLFLVGGASTLTQIVAVASLGLPVTLQWSTGGLVAFIAAIWMWIQCRSWASWRKWVWLPAVVTVVLAFVTINLTVANARQAAEQQAAEEHAAACAAAKTEIASKTAMQEDLLDRTWKYKPSPFARDDDWRPEPPTDGRWDVLDKAAGLPTEADVWDFYVSYGGPQLETDISQSQAAYEAECVSQ